MKLLASRSIGRSSARVRFHRAAVRVPARRLVIMNQGKDKKGQSSESEPIKYDTAILVVTILGVAVTCLMLGSNAISELQTAVDKIGDKVDKALEKDAQIQGSNKVLQDLVTSAIKKNM